MQPTPTIREACFGDYAGIRSLSIRNGLMIEPYEEWKHLWVNNPAYSQRRGWSIGWVIEAGSEIVGFIGNIPRAYEYEGRSIAAAATRGLAVDSNYRSYSFALVHRFYRQPDVGLLLCTSSANEAASKSHKVFQAREVPAGIWNRAVFWIAGYSGFISSALQTKSVPLASAFSVPLGAALWLKDKISAHSMRADCNELTVNSCRQFDERFDTFWKELRRESPRRLLAMRTRETLDWLFKRPLSSDQACVLTAENDLRLAAYAIFRRQDNATRGLKRLRLVDFQALGGKTKLLVPMLTWALDKCRKDGIHMLEVIGFAHEKKQLLDSLAPYQRTLPSWMYYYKATDKQLSEALGDPNAWDPCFFDGDSSFP